jgi:microcystin-dependent protein
MNKIDLTQQGGFPFTQDTLDFMQTAYNDCFGALAALLGDRVIITGCGIAGNVVGPGIVAVGGEILPCAGGALSPAPDIGMDAWVYVAETRQAAVFEDGEHRDVYFRRSLNFGVGDPQWWWSTFKPLTKIVDLMSMTVPSGAIMMWFGTNVPAGWRICDGTNGTPDLRGRFALGVSSSYPMGAQGGAATHRLAATEMPSHSHGITDPGHSHYLSFNSQNPSGGTGHAGPRETNPNATAFSVRASLTNIKVNSTGGGGEHNNMPPYTALYYIMKI